jgi:hypothetical protein
MRRIYLDVTMKDSFWLLRRKINEIFYFPFSNEQVILFPWCRGECSKYSNFISSQDSVLRANIGVWRK